MEFSRLLELRRQSLKCGKGKGAKITAQSNREEKAARGESSGDMHRVPIES